MNTQNYKTNPNKNCTISWIKTSKVCFNFKSILQSIPPQSRESLALTARSVKSLYEQVYFPSAKTHQSISYIKVNEEGIEVALININQFVITFGEGEGHPETLPDCIRLGLLL